MCIFDNVFFIALAIVFSVNFFMIRVHSDDRDDDDSDKEEESPTDDYLFVALIDIVFTDGSKRTCTGTIIHDNVVITAAHCFTKEKKQPELTASFVVIGTKKMFDTGYEQYLPIERVIIHPNHKGWTADLGLVHTFAGMMSDKPGRIVRLASEKISTDADVTVYSWGRTNEELNTITKMTSYLPDRSCSDDEINESGRSFVTKQRAKITNTTTMESDLDFNDPTSIYTEEPIADTTKLGKRKRKRKRLLRQRTGQYTKNVPRVIKITQTHELFENITSTEDGIVNTKKMLAKSHTPYRKYRKDKKYMHYRNKWRRNMGDQKNKLTVEVFGFVNTQACKKILEKAMSSFYDIQNPNDILCYSSEEHFITEEDAGAPALRVGRLVAVTVGGVLYDGERVSVGMKIICFCSWIANNLPKTGAKIQCCKNCCEGKEDKVTKKDGEYKHSRKKRKKRIL